jgi:two-component system NtrC family response regulator
MNGSDFSFKGQFLEGNGFIGSITDEIDRFGLILQGKFAMNKLLIIDDEDKLRSLLSRILEDEGFQVFQAPEGRSGLKKLSNEDVDVVICDMKLPGENGLEILEKIHRDFPMIEVILLTAYGNIHDGVKAIQLGAFDYLVKGDDNDKIIPLVYKAVEKVSLNRKLSNLEHRLHVKHSFEAITGNSQGIKRALDLASKVAPQDTTVLITGETGTGKEIFANAIHHASKRQRKNFVAINCSAFSKEILESEIFGHLAGAFTGAIKDKKGLFEEAHGGTIFLDEIGEMAPELQSKFLRVLELGEFVKVGDTKPTKVDVRIIAATNRDLKKEVADGHFRSDLFFRLSVFQIELPPLRLRLEDIPVLVSEFVPEFCHKLNTKHKQPSEAFLKMLCQYSWPGNIRELRNVIERSVILSSDDSLQVESLPQEIREPVKQTNADKTISAFDLASAEKLHIQKILNHTSGNKTEAARLLNIGLTTLYRKIEDYGILV